MSAHKPRVVFDCMVYLQAAARETSGAGACWLMAKKRQIKLFTSWEILNEVQDVLGRDRIRQRFNTLTDESVADFIADARKVAAVLRKVPSYFDYHERDAKDEPYLNLAIEVSADYLISRDNDLLDLMSWKRETGREFQKRYPFLRIVTPETFLAEVIAANETP
mgnify:CR=1 FL=1